MLIKFSFPRFPFSSIFFSFWFLVSTFVVADGDGDGDDDDDNGGISDGDGDLGGYGYGYGHSDAEANGDTGEGGAVGGIFFVF